MNGHRGHVPSHLSSVVGVLIFAFANLIYHAEVEERGLLLRAAALFFLICMDE
jgi:hypothetical protein